ncbi:hypothetical protein CBM2586_A50463 [Cupriavidus phytorum]|uniref:Uncharacterized protein n=1 Tax=Cupriavidus taiwanensis TaxID=164546 RepID=A0A976A571_9BURK|nr:hypothetical protein CBM2586_A50463 [Cupriavidus taiwanensis]
MVAIAAGPIVASVSCGHRYPATASRAKSTVANNSSASKRVKGLWLCFMNHAKHLS